MLSDEEIIKLWQDKEFGGSFSGMKNDYQLNYTKSMFPYRRIIFKI